MKRLLIIISLVLLLPLAAAGVLLNTTAPLKWAAGKLPGWTGGAVSVGKASGTLAGVIVLDDIRIQAGNDVITVKRVEAEADPLALLAATASLPHLRIADVRYHFRPTVKEVADDAAAFDYRKLAKNLQLPLTLDLPDIRVNSFSGCRLQQAGGSETCETWLQNITLGLAWDDTEIRISNLKGQSEHSAASGNLYAGLADPYTINVDIQANSSLRQPPLAAALKIDGSVAEMNFELALSRDTAGQQSLASLDGRLRDLLDTAELDATLQIDSLSLADLNGWLGLQLPEDTWSATGEVSGKLGDGPGNARFNGRVSGSFGPLQEISGNVRAHWQQQQLRIQSAKLKMLPLSDNLATDTTLDFSDGFAWHGSANIPHATWPGTEALNIRAATVEAKGDAEQLDAQVQTKLFGEAGKAIGIDGRLEFDTLTFSATVTAPAVQIADAVQLDSVHLQASGKPSDYQFQGNGSAILTVAGDKLPAARWKLSGRGNLQSVDSTLQEIVWLDGKLGGQVRVDWHDAPRITGRIDGQQLDISKLQPLAGMQIGGRLSPAFDFRLLMDKALDAGISGLQLAGNYNGHEVAGSGDLAWRNDRLVANGFRLAVGDAQLQLHSASGKSSGILRLELDVPQLATVLPDASGRLKASMDIDPGLRAPAASGELTAEALHWRDWQIGKAEITMNLPLTTGSTVDIQAGSSGSVSAKLANIRLAATSLDSVELKLSGRRATHEFSLDLAAAHHRMTLQGNGMLDDTNAWQVKLDKWQIKNNIDLPEWQLASAGRINIAADSFLVETHCLASGKARACVGPLRKTAEQVTANAKLTSLPLASFEPLLPGGVRITGVADGSLEFRDDASGRLGTARIELNPGSIMERRFSDTGESEANDALLASWNSGSLEARLQDRLLTAQASLDLGGTGKASAKGRIRFPQDGAAADASLDGNVTINIADLSLLPAFFPRVREVHGKLVASLETTGTLGAPVLTGKLDFTNGTAELTPLGTTWQDIELHLKASRNRLDGTASLSSDGGKLDIGISGNARGEQLSANLTVNGENFLALRIPEAVVRLSPDLRMQLENRHVQASGTVKVPYARIRPRDLSNAVQVSDDQVIVNRSAMEERRNFTYEAQVTTVLGEDVRFEGFGLEAQLDGRLTVSAGTGTPATGSGEVSIESGEYRIYGQELNIVRGKLIYTGQPLTDPGLDVRAIRDIRSGVTVGLNLRGTASRPQLEVFSDPPMSQGETLSYLISGGSIAEATGEEKQQVDSASVALGLGAGKIFSQVGERVGVDEVRFSQVGNREEASLILGKYLSPDLYVGYGIGLFDAVNSFRVNYQLSSKWTLEAISGIKSSADLIYTIER